MSSPTLLENNNASFRHADEEVVYEYEEEVLDDDDDDGVEVEIETDEEEEGLGSGSIEETKRALRRMSLQITANVLKNSSHHTSSSESRRNTWNNHFGPSSSRHEEKTQLLMEGGSNNSFHHDAAHETSDDHSEKWTNSPQALLLKHGFIGASELQSATADRRRDLEIVLVDEDDVEEEIIEEEVIEEEIYEEEEVIEEEIVEELFVEEEVVAPARASLVLEPFLERRLNRMGLGTSTRTGLLSAVSERTMETDISGSVAPPGRANSNLSLLGATVAPPGRASSQISLLGAPSAASAMSATTATTATSAASKPQQEQPAIIIEAVDMDAKRKEDAELAAATAAASGEDDDEKGTTDDCNKSIDTNEILGITSDDEDSDLDGDGEDDDDESPEDVKEAIIYILKQEKPIDNGHLTSEQATLLMAAPFEDQKQILQHFELCDNAGDPICWDLLIEMVTPDGADDDGGDQTEDGDGNSDGDNGKPELQQHAPVVCLPCAPTKVEDADNKSASPNNNEKRPALDEMLPPPIRESRGVSFEVDEEEIVEEEIEVIEDEEVDHSSEHGSSESGSGYIDSDVDYNSKEDNCSLGSGFSLEADRVVCNSPITHHEDTEAAEDEEYIFEVIEELIPEQDENVRNSHLRAMREVKEHRRSGSA